MRMVVQRVSRALVTVEERTVGEIGPGLLVFLGVGREEGEAEVGWAVSKIAGLRIFEDEEGRMNRSVEAMGGSVLLVSQFTLFGDVRKGRRPAFTAAAEPELADRLYQEVAAGLRELSIPVETGTFRAHMEVELLNDGPVTILLDSEKRF